ncbi:putative CCR4-NOT transcription complex subunit 4 [Blattamonas nauphoetae]|uniref:CCR4-NOT transcription complex subunit 4 n=1 Tax=Blattamonas nauphoetae TaxID=2049346 RepID=A0ABQ9X9B9_9EUKA|nr:putative CCR4-NOT transcription complex subunit 4 [Blattamonas nauphoetae]
MKRMKFPKERPTECPICSGEMDEMDQTFFPCPCHFQLCAFCYNTISKSDHPNCPYCRQPYDEDNHVYHKKPEAPKQKQPAKKVDKLDDRDVEALSKKRVLQRNLVYVTGLPPKIATDEILRSDHFFGRFGQVTYIEVAVPPNVNRNHLKCAYISYADDESAKKAIEALNKVPYAGSIIKFVVFFSNHTYTS